jgi:acyl transferase domain-containing protein
MTTTDDAMERVSKLSPKRLALLAIELQERLSAIEHKATEQIAIVGLSCRFPGGVDGPAAFWRLLRDGTDAITDVPKDRWDVDVYYDPELSSPITMNTRWGGFIHGVDGFDPEFFGISYREACAMDPQQRLLLEAAWEALEHAGLSADQIAGSDTGVFVGGNAIDYYSLMRNPPTRGGSGVALSILANRLSHLFDLRGPSMTIDTACSSSLVAVDLACQSLRSGATRMALAGGVNLILSPVTTIAASQAGMMSPDGRCKTFDARANGYVRSEGCGLVVLKRLTDAVADGDHVLAVIRGSAANQDGRTGVLTAPSGLAQQAVIRRALANANVDPSAVSYIETHGTGTPLGDSIEVEALGKVFGARGDGSRCALGSVKTNLGHTEAAAGVAGLVKLILALQHRTIPPIIHFQEQNPHMSLEGTPLFIPTEACPWPAGPQPRIAGLSSFGFGGTNVHLVLEEAPARVVAEPTGDAGRSWHVLPLSARSDAALRSLAERYVSHFTEHPDTPFAEACYVAGAGRRHFSHRLAITASNAEDARCRLQQHLDAATDDDVRHGLAMEGRKPKLAFLFAGQGSQYAGMGRRLYETEPVFRNALDRCADILDPLLPLPLRSTLFPAPGAAPVIDDTRYAQPALFALEYALAELWRSRGIVPDVVMGHSVGEYVAACIAGVFSLEDGLALIAARGQLMAGTRPGAMALVSADAERVAEVLADRQHAVSIAAVNGPRGVVISGDPDEVAAVQEIFDNEYVFTTPLKVTRAFHSPLIEPMLDAFRTRAAAVRFQPPTIPMVANISGRLFEPGVVPDADYWCRHARLPVMFAAGVHALSAFGCDTLLEIGPQDTLVKTARRCLTPDASHAMLLLPSLAPGDTAERVQQAAISALYVRGLPIDWHGLTPESARRRIPLPTYPFERQRCWLSANELRPFPREDAEP